MSETGESPSWFQGAVINLEPLAVVMIVVIAQSEIPKTNFYLVLKTRWSYHGSSTMLIWEYIVFHLLSNFLSVGEATPSS